MGISKRCIWEREHIRRTNLGNEVGDDGIVVVGSLFDEEGALVGKDAEGGEAREAKEAEHKEEEAKPALEARDVEREVAVQNATEACEQRCHGVVCKHQQRIPILPAAKEGQSETETSLQMRGEDAPDS